MTSACCWRVHVRSHQKTVEEDVKKHPQTADDEVEQVVEELKVQHHDFVASCKSSSVPDETYQEDYFVTHLEDMVTSWCGHNIYNVYCQLCCSKKKKKRMWQKWTSALQFSVPEEPATSVRSPLVNVFIPHRFFFFFLKVKNHTVTINVRHRKRWLKEGEKERSSTVHLCKVIKQKSNMTETETVPETKLKFTQCLLTNTGFEMSQTHGDSRRSFYSSMLEWADQ